MEGRNELVSALSVQLSMACIFCTAVYWFAQAGQTGLIFPLALLPYGPAVYGLNRLFLRRERSARALVLFNCAVGLALFGAMAADIGWGRWWTLVSAAVFCAWLTVRGAGLVMEPPALPTSTVIRPSCCSIRSASRITWRLRWNCSARTRSEGSRSPGFNRPLAIC